MSVTTKDADREILYRAYADRDRPISEAIVAALAAVEKVDPEDFDLRLYDSVDTDALDRLIEAAAERGERLRIAFTIGDYEVTVEDSGLLLVRERRSDAETSRDNRSRADRSRVQALTKGCDESHPERPDSEGPQSQPQ